MKNDIPITLGVILAGGRAQRLNGQDKALTRIGDRTLLELVRARLAPQCDGLILNANGDLTRFTTPGVPPELPIVPDGVPGFAGPLAGVLAGLDWTATHRDDISWIVTAAVDCPFLPHDLVARLHHAREAAGTRLARARSGGQAHHTMGLWPVALRDTLRHALEKEDMRKVALWTEHIGVAEAAWDDNPIDPFFNVNTPEDVSTAARWMGR